jgi:hypothetical protein
MAVTQQLARLPADLLQRCRDDAAVLGELVSFTLLPSHCHLDLDWAPSELMAAAREARDAAAEAALRMSCAGIRAVNQRFSKVEVFEPPMELDPGEVRFASAALARLDIDAMLSKGEPMSAEAAEALRARFVALAGFYAEAAALNEAVVMWWD